MLSYLKSEYFITCGKFTNSYYKEMKFRREALNHEGINKMIDSKGKINYN